MEEKRSLNTPGSVLWAGTMTVPPVETKRRRSRRQETGNVEKKRSSKTLCEIVCQLVEWFKVFLICPYGERPGSRSISSQRP